MEPPGGQRCRTVGTDVTQGKNLAALRAPQHDRLAQHLDPFQPTGFQVAGQGAEVPGIGEEALAEWGRQRSGPGCSTRHVRL